MKFNLAKREYVKDVDQNVKYNKDHENWERTLSQVQVELVRRVM